MSAHLAVSVQPSDSRREEQVSTPVPWQQVVGFSGLAYALSWLWWAPLVWPYLSRLTLTEPLPNALADAGAGRAALVGLSIRHELARAGYILDTHLCDA